MLCDKVCYFLASIALAFGILTAALDRLVQLIAACYECSSFSTQSTFYCSRESQFMFHDFSFFWAVFLSTLYVFGIFWGIEVISFVKSTSSSSANIKLTIDELCGVCGNNQCKRHHKSPRLSPIPKVPKGFDSTLENVS